MHDINEILSPYSEKISKKLKSQNNFKLDEGCYVYELEADTTIPSEYIMLMHFLGEINFSLEKKIANYIINLQSKDGGWPLFFDGESDLSATVKAIMH